MTSQCSQFADLSDDQLLAEVQRLASTERRATVALLRSLIELDARRLYLREGCSSLFTYCTQVLRLSEGGAYNRIEVARAAQRYPALLEHLEDGSLTLTTARLIAPHIDPDNHDAVFAAARQKSKRDVEVLIASMNPSPAPPPSVGKLPVRPSSPIAETAASERRVPTQLAASKPSLMGKETPAPPVIQVRTSQPSLTRRHRRTDERYHSGDRRLSRRTMMMRRALVQIIACAVLATVAAAGASQETAVNGHDAFTEVIRALGDPRQVASVKGFTAIGTLRLRNQYFGKMPEAKTEFMSQRFVTNVLFPDHHIERAEVAHSAITYRGFAGSKLLNRGVLGDGGPMAAYFPPTMIDVERASFGYLVLSLLFNVDSLYPFALIRVSHDSMVLKSPDGIEVNVELDPTSKRVHRIAFKPPAAGMTGTLPNQKITTTTIELSDHRDIDGLWLPHKMITLRDGRLEMERYYESIDLTAAHADGFRALARTILRCLGIPLRQRLLPIGNAVGVPCSLSLRSTYGTNALYAAGGDGGDCKQHERQEYERECSPGTG